MVTLYAVAALAACSAGAFAPAAPVPRRVSSAVRVLDDAFELAAAEALAEEMQERLKGAKAMDRMGVVVAAEVLDEATSLEAIEQALAGAHAVGVPDDAPEVLAAAGRRQKLLDSLARDTVVETLDASVITTPAELTALTLALDEAVALGLDRDDPAVARAAAKCRAFVEAASGSVEDAAALAAAAIFRDEGHALYDDFRPPAPPRPDENVTPDL